MSRLFASARNFTSIACSAPANPALAALQDSPLLNAHSIVVNRGVEWLTVLAGVEQANLYTVTNGAGAPLGLIAERGGGSQGILMRQLLRNHRQFTADVFDSTGRHPVARITRPAYWLAGSATVSLPDGVPVGEVRRTWHPYRRLYRLYLGKQQFAAIQEGVLAWDFQLRDVKGGTLGLVDRHFRDPARELLSDAGRYALHFGGAPPLQAAPDGDLPGGAARSGTAPAAEGPILQHRPRVSDMARLRTGVQVIATVDGDLLEVARLLSAAERLVALAAAVCIDFDFFSAYSWKEGYLTGDLIQEGGLPGGAQQGGSADNQETWAQRAGASGQAARGDAGMEEPLPGWPGVRLSHGRLQGGHGVGKEGKGVAAAGGASGGRGSMPQQPAAMDSSANVTTASSRAGGSSNSSAASSTGALGGGSGHITSSSGAAGSSMAPGIGAGLLGHTVGGLGADGTVDSGGGHIVDTDDV